MLRLWFKTGHQAAATPTEPLPPPEKQGDVRVQAESPVDFMPAWHQLS